MMMRIQPYLLISVKFYEPVSVRTVCTDKFNTFRKEKTMKTTKSKIRCGGMLTIVVLALGLMVWSAPIVQGAQYLTVNGADVTSITLELGQSRTIEVVSTDGMSYVTYVGFDNGVVRGNFSHRQTKPQAGDRADVVEVNQPAFYGYYVNATGISQPPSAGVHFVFEYVALQVGETDLKLYQNNPPPSPGQLLDSVHITVIPLQPVAMGTAFTYQGRLMDSNSTADGLYDFQFKLYDNADPVFAAQQGSTIDINDLDVFDGYFTVELNFGSSVFDGNSVWLEILVRPGDSNDVSDFVTLSPRQQVTPTPYALQTRGIFVDNSENIGIGTTSPTGKLHVDGGKAAGGVDGKSITIIAQDGGDGKIFGGRGRPGGDIILMPGRGGMSSTPPWPPIQARSGNVGIGTAGPEAMLDVRGNIKVDQKIQAYDSGGLELATNEGTTRIFIGDDGKVGIGTTSPSEKLDVEGNIDVSSNQIKNYYGFPRPNYDSGWVSIVAGSSITLSHNLGGSVDNYVVDMQFKGGLGIHCRGYGVDEGSSGLSEGVLYRYLGTNTISIYRYSNDHYVEQVRIRIWVYQ